MPTLFHKTCPVCSVNFSVVSRYKKKIFCSKECHFEHISRTAKNPKLKKCINCQEDIINKHAKKFCCQSCSATYNNKNRDPECNTKQKQTLMATLTDKGLAKTDAKEIYKDSCAFKFSPYEYPAVLGYQLLLQYGIYNHHKNRQGVVRDHIVSKEYGWNNKVPGDIISHPANCQFISNIENCKKGADSHMSYEDLLKRIEVWNTNSQPVISQKRIKAKSPVNKKEPLYDYPRPPKKNRHLVYRWRLQSKFSLEIEETMNITQWMKEKNLSTSEIYGNNPIWVIVEKYHLKTSRRII